MSGLFERFAGSPLRPIAGKVAEGRRLSFEDGVALFGSPDVLGVGALANFVREKKHGNTAYYNVNRYLNPTNLCWVDCALCAWARKPGVAGGYTMSIEEAVAESAAGWHDGITELHIVGGLHPSLPYSWYLDLLRALKVRFPGVHLKAWTMVEIDWIARIAKKDVGTVIGDLKAAGMDSCPGGGAEIFEKRVRDVICRDKISGERWLEVAKLCHENGVRTHVTMLYGSVETIEDRVDHLVRIRELQDVTGGFLGFIPLAFHPGETQLPDVPAATGLTDLKVIAVARLMLDNVDHVKAYWVQIGEKLAPVALHFGADDLVGTVTEETITHAAGAKTESGLSRAEMERMIRGAGREPFERDAFYERVVRDETGRVLRANRFDFSRQEDRDSSKEKKADHGLASSPAASATTLDASIASS
ncbi:MAG: aminofutalosine synthase MqnE [Thermoanaerobaculia bacterium]|nr:aminofutalosine synthase MqnE [Thermoanaerobaculia bacterium]